MPPIQPIFLNFILAARYGENPTYTKEGLQTHESVHPMISGPLLQRGVSTSTSDPMSYIHWREWGWGGGGGMAASSLAEGGQGTVVPTK